MKKTFLLCLLFSLTNSLFANDKIVGGDFVDPAVLETSHIVSLGGGCAGSIIAAKWILTAAHCQPVISRYVTAGHINLKSKERIKLEVKKAYPHPKYNPKTYSHDFVLIELKYAIHFENMGLKAIDLLTPTLVEQGAIEPGTKAMAMGWGSVREGGSSSNLLMYVELPIVSREVANAENAYKGLVEEAMIPAGYAAGKKDSCQGDSGGPFTIMGADAKPILAGVISWGNGCARPNLYGLYANVAFAYPWIMETINK
nr:serine protease [Bacteriovorax sp. HI3]